MSQNPSRDPASPPRKLCQQQSMGVGLIVGRQVATVSRECSSVPAKDRQAAVLWGLTFTSTASKSVYCSCGGMRWWAPTEQHAAVVCSCAKVRSSQAAVLRVHAVAWHAWTGTGPGWGFLEPQ